MRRRDVGPAIPSAGLRSATYRPPRPGSLRMTATPADASVADFDPADPASYSFWTEERLRYADLDPLSHVNNNAIGVFLENGRVYLFRASGGAGGDDSVWWVVRRLEVDFVREIHFPGRVRPGTRVAKTGPTPSIRRTSGRERVWKYGNVS